MKGLYEEITHHINQGFLRFHTPAHLGRNPYVNRILKGKFDLTELSQTDNLSNPQGILKEMEARLTHVFLATRASLLANGATSGNLALMSLFSPGEEVILDRGSHLSAFRGLALSGATGVFTTPQLNSSGIPLPPKAEEIEALLLKHPNCKGIFITSPNYYGLQSDIRAIAKLAKKRNIPLLVDEAHGAHRYYLNPKETAMGQGADATVVSLHKTLPALTQTGALLIGSFHPRLEEIQEEIRNFTSTSPSYLMMLAADGMLAYMKEKGTKKLRAMEQAGRRLQESLLAAGVEIEETPDPLRLVVHTKKGSASLLEKEFGILPELEAGETLVFLLSLHHQKSELKKLYKALCSLPKPTKMFLRQPILPRQRFSLREAARMRKRIVPIEKAQGKICGEYVLLFPPSVPVLLLGEEISQEMIPILKENYEKETITVLDWE